MRTNLIALTAGAVIGAGAVLAYITGRDILWQEHWGGHE